MQERLNQHFTPYVSPLKHFRAYRYHPEYTNDVLGGYRSLTFSHNINPDKPLCVYEAAGGICNDHSCDDQHFRDMSLSGALIELIYRDRDPFRILLWHYLRSIIWPPLPQFSYSLLLKLLMHQSPSLFKCCYLPCCLDADVGTR